MKKLVFSLTILQLVAADHRDWKTAVLTETHRSGNATGDQVYTFDLGDLVIVCTDPPIRMRLKPVNISVGSKVQYSRSGGSLVVLDTKGKERKLQIQQETMKSASQ